MMGKEPHELFVEVFEFYEAHHAQAAIAEGET